MKAKPEPPEAFEQFLIDACQEGGKLLAERKKTAWEFLNTYRAMNAGYHEKKCACGKAGQYVATIQPIPAWPAEKYVLCDEHAAVVNAYESLKRLIWEDEQPKHLKAK